MKRVVGSLTMALVMAAMVAASALSAFAQGGCQAFGQNVGGLATNLGERFGQTTAGSAPLNDTVVQEQTALCNPG